MRDTWSPSVCFCSAGPNCICAPDCARCDEEAAGTLDDGQTRTPLCYDHAPEVLEQIDHYEECRNCPDGGPAPSYNVTRAGETMYSLCGTCADEWEGMRV